MYFSPILVPFVALFLSVATSAPTDTNGGLLVRNHFDPLDCRMGSFATTQINNVVGDGPGKSCFGFNGRKPSKCGGPWSASEVYDIKDAVRQQVTQDGAFQLSTSGGWESGFLYTTTAFADRDTSAFNSQLDKVNVEGNLGAGQQAYFWQRGRDVLWVGRAQCTGRSY